VKGWHATYRVTLQAPDCDGDAPPAVRLRHALKRAWRSDRLRCVRAEQLSFQGWGPVDDSLPLEHGAGI
jgi:hypothetical protein